MKIYSTLKPILVICGIIAGIADRNYFTLQLAKKLFNIDFEYKFLDYLYLFDIKRKLNEK